MTTKSTVLLNNQVDRYTMLSAFANRQPWTFAPGLSMIINWMGHEDGSGMSFICEGYLTDSDRAAFHKGANVSLWMRADRPTGVLGYKR